MTQKSDQYTIVRWPLRDQKLDQIPSRIVCYDCDVVGVQGVWKKQIQKAARAHGLVLHLVMAPEFSSDPIYRQALQDFVTELRPLEVLAPAEYSESLRPLIPEVQVLQAFADEPSWGEDLRALIHQFFPKTLKELGVLRPGLIEAYLETVSQSSHWLRVEGLRTFPMFLKERFPEMVRDFPQLVYMEWSLLELAFVDIGSVRPKTQKGKLGLNQTLRFLEFHGNRFIEPGLWALYREESLHQRAERLKPREALIIDLVREDRAFSLEELAQLLAIYNPLLPMSAREATALIHSLCAREILFLQES